MTQAALRYVRVHPGGKEEQGSVLFARSPNDLITEVSITGEDDGILLRAKHQPAYDGLLLFSIVAGNETTLVNKLFPGESSPPGKREAYVLKGIGYEFRFQLTHYDLPILARLLPFKIAVALAERWEKKFG